MKENERQKVLVDTNILLYIYDGFDPFLSIIERFDYKPEFYIHKAVLNELKTVRDRGKGFAMRARVNVAMNYLERFSDMWKTVGEECHEAVDQCLLNLAKDMNLIVMTNDRLMKERALKEGIKVLYVQGKGKIIKSLVPL